MSVIRYKKKDRLAYITLDRPNSLNAISRELAAELLEALVDFDNNPELWVGIITGSGDRSFSAGADLKDASHRVHPEEWEADFVMNLNSIEKPLIAAVNGYCLGAGFTVALSCDIRIAAQNASFGTPDQKLNLVDAYASLALVRFVSPAIAMKILFTGEMIDATEAYRLGLVSDLVSQEELLPAAERMANKICSNGPLAVRACKQLSKRGRTLTLEEGLFLFKSLARPVIESEDTEEGIKAFFEKREPAWKGK